MFSSENKMAEKWQKFMILKVGNEFQMLTDIATTVFL
jgi:hypothetical protein